jgi:hypothetical protein
MHPLAFLVGCIGTRAALAYAAYAVRQQRSCLRYLGIAALVPAIGFLLLSATGWRQTGAESSAPGRRIWWAALRPVHGLLWLAFAAAAIAGHPAAWTALALDVTLGLVAWILHHAHGNGVAEK